MIQGENPCQVLLVLPGLMSAPLQVSQHQCLQKNLYPFRGELEKPLWANNTPYPTDSFPRTRSVPARRASNSAQKESLPFEGTRHCRREPTLHHTRRGQRHLFELRYICSLNLTEAGFTTRRTYRTIVEQTINLGTSNRKIACSGPISASLILPHC